MLRSIDKRIQASKAQNVSAACFLDASLLSSFPVAPDSLTAVLAINVVNISTPATLPGIIDGASCKLKIGGILVFYGPWSLDGIITPHSNVKLDMILKLKQKDFMLRDITTLRHLITQAGNLELEGVRYLDDTNNYIITVRRTK